MSWWAWLLLWAAAWPLGRLLGMLAAWLVERWYARRVAAGGSGGV